MPPVLEPDILDPTGGPDDPGIGVHDVGPAPISLDSGEDFTKRGGIGDIGDLGAQSRQLRRRRPVADLIAANALTDEIVELTPQFLPGDTVRVV